MATVIAVSNLKGGVGKTSTCFHLGGVLAARGHRVLLVDADPQGSLTQAFLGAAEFRGLDPSATIDSVYAGTALPERVIRPSGFPGLDVVPSSLAADRWNMVPKPGWQDHESSIRDLVDEVSGEYDRVLIDTPPNLHLCTHSALYAAEWALTPLQPEVFGAQGILSVNEALNVAQAASGGRPALLGYLISMYQKNLNIHKKFRKILREVYGDLVFDTEIPLSKDFKEAVALRRPMSHSDKPPDALLAMSRLVDEINGRMGERRVAA